MSTTRRSPLRTNNTLLILRVVAGSNREEREEREGEHFRHQSRARRVEIVEKLTKEKVKGLRKS